MEILEIIENLKSHGCVGFKSSYEDEGLQDKDVYYLRNLCTKSDIKLYVKIGGVEAKRDIFMAKEIDVNGIVAPMVESKFALKKFVKSLKSYKFENVGINIESICAFKNFEEIKSSKYFEFVDSLTIGRVDFSSSLDNNRIFVDSEEMLDMSFNILRGAKECGKKTYLGGNININSKKFIEFLYDKKLLDFIETRNVIFDLSKLNMEYLNTALYYANFFELRFMESIQKKYISLALKDDERIKMIDERIKKNIPKQ